MLTLSHVVNKIPVGEGFAHLKPALFRERQMQPWPSQGQYPPPQGRLDPLACMVGTVWSVPGVNVVRRHAVLEEG